jgi:hypothetical protein
MAKNNSLHVRDEWTARQRINLADTRAWHPGKNPQNTDYFPFEAVILTLSEVERGRTPVFRFCSFCRWQDTPTLPLWSLAGKS